MRSLPCVLRYDDNWRSLGFEDYSTQFPIFDQKAIGGE
jgi:hypothetical protein